MIIIIYTKLVGLLFLNYFIKDLIRPIGMELWLFHIMKLRKIH